MFVGVLVPASKGQDTGLSMVLLGLALWAVLIMDGTPLPSAEIAGGGSLRRGGGDGDVGGVGGVGVFCASARAC